MIRSPRPLSLNKFPCLFFFLFWCARIIGRSVAIIPICFSASNFGFKPLLALRLNFRNVRFPLIISDCCPIIFVIGQEKAKIIHERVMYFLGRSLAFPADLFSFKCREAFQRIPLILFIGCFSLGLTFIEFAQRLIDDFLLVQQRFIGFFNREAGLNIIQRQTKPGAGKMNLRPEQIGFNCGLNSDRSIKVLQRCFITSASHRGLGGTNFLPCPTAGR